MNNTITIAKHDVLELTVARNVKGKRTLETQRVFVCGLESTPEGDVVISYQSPNGAIMSKHMVRRVPKEFGVQSFKVMTRATVAA